MSTLIHNSRLFNKATEDSRAFSQPNVGSVDRLFRLGIASLLIMDGLHGTGPLGLESLLMMASIPLIASAIIAWDPLYALFKVRSATIREPEPQALKADAVLNPNGGINVGSLDRIVRIMTAGLLLATPFLWTESIGAVAIAGTFAGVILMMTAIMGWDPVYRLAKVRTTTVRTGTAPQSEYNTPVYTFELVDEVQGDTADILQEAA